MPVEGQMVRQRIRSNPAVVYPEPMLESNGTQGLGDNLECIESRVRWPPGPAQACWCPCWWQSSRRSWPDCGACRLTSKHRVPWSKRPNGVKLMNGRETVRTLHLPLRRTALCLDCETCFEIGSGPCPVCGSGTWASVARFLDGRLPFAEFPRKRPLRSGAGARREH
jgi:hypothetical protein